MLVASVELLSLFLEYLAQEEDIMESSRLSLLLSSIPGQPGLMTM